LIVIICGLPGVGKTSLARDLAIHINAIVLSTDKIRKELIPYPNYSIGERRLVYDVMLLLAKYLHNAGVNCILDATFNRESSRRQAKRKLALNSSELRVIECVCPESVIISRLKTRKNDFSDADVSIYKKMKTIYEPVREPHITADTTKPSSINAKEIADKILNRYTDQ
jgi:predicted kinase